MASVNILHISDVHFGMPDHTAEQDRIVNALVDKAHAVEIQPDLCIFSGDLAHSGRSEQFQRGQMWLKKLAARWRGIPFVAVPGNHDADRNKAAKEFLRPASNAESSYQLLKSKIQENMKHLDAFFQWHRVAMSEIDLRSDWNDPFGFHHEMNINDIIVHLVGLNTALLSCDNDDEHKLAVDTATLNQALAQCDEKRGLIVAVGHHPLEWLSDWNQKEISRLLSQERGAHLYLHGHLHEPLGSSRNDNVGRSLAPLAAGAAYQGSKWPQFFAFYRINLNEKEIESETFKYSGSSGTWLADATRSHPILARFPSLPRASIEASGNSVLTPPPPSPSMNEARGVEEVTQSAKRWLELFLDRTHQIRGACYAIESKVNLSVIQKVESRRASKISYGPQHLVDALTVRLITLYQSGIEEVVSRLLGEIKEPSSDDSPFLPDRRVEVDIFTSRPDADPLSVVASVQDVLQSCGLPVVSRVQSRIGYSSVELVTTCRTGLDESGLQELPVRFQVRSAVEEIWGEIDRRLRYGVAQGGAPQVSWSRHLSVFRTLVDGCIQYADASRGEAIEEAPTPPAEARLAQSVEPGTVELARLRCLPKELFEQVEAAYQNKEIALQGRRSPGATGRFREAADAFLKSIDDLARRTDVEEDCAEQANYVARTERAYLLMLTGDKDDLAESRRIYEMILDPGAPKCRPHDAVAHFRLGQLDERQERLGDALAHLEHARHQIDKDADQRVLRHNWVYDAIRLEIAKVHWRRFEDRSKPRSERLPDIQTAIRIANDTLDNLAANSQRLRATNDLLYYLWEEYNLLGERETPTFPREVFSTLCSELRTAIEADPNANYEHLDTLARALQLCDDSEGARRVAVRVRDTLQKVVQERTGRGPSERPGSFAWYEDLRGHLNRDEADALRYASDLLLPAAD